MFLHLYPSCNSQGIFRGNNMPLYTPARTSCQCKDLGTVLEVQVLPVDLGVQGDPFDNQDQLMPMPKENK